MTLPIPCTTHRPRVDVALVYPTLTLLEEPCVDARTEGGTINSSLWVLIVIVGAEADGVL